MQKVHSETLNQIRTWKHNTDFYYFTYLSFELSFNGGAWDTGVSPLAVTLELASSPMTDGFLVASSPFVDWLFTDSSPITGLLSSPVEEGFLFSSVGTKRSGGTTGVGMMLMIFFLWWWWWCFFLFLMIIFLLRRLGGGKCTPGSNCKIIWITFLKV